MSTWPATKGTKLIPRTSAHCDEASGSSERTVATGRATIAPRTSAKHKPIAPQTQGLPVTSFRSTGAPGSLMLKTCQTWARAKVRNVAVHTLSSLAPRARREARFAAMALAVSTRPWATIDRQ